MQNTHSRLRRTSLRTLLAGATIAATGLRTPASAQADYPNKPVRLVLTFPPGGLSDSLSRVYTKELQERLGQPFVIDFKPGAATNIGAAIAAQAPPDGYTLLVTTIASNVLNKWTYRKLPFDPEAFLNVGLLGVNTLYLMVGASSPYRTVQELVQAAKQSAGGLSYGSFGAGGPNHLIAEQFRRATGIAKLLHVPYKGANEAVVDLIAGRIDFLIDGATINLVDGGKLRALAVCFPRRWPTQPTIPTMAEAGFPDVTISTYFGLAAPPQTPAPILDKLNDALRAIASAPEMEKKLLALNVLPQPLSREQTEGFMRQQRDKWGPVLQSLNVQLD